MTVKLIDVIDTVAVTAAVAVPFRLIVCVALVAFRALSVRTSEPLMEPVDCGAKLTGNVQVAPADKVPALLEDVATCGQVAELRVKFVERLGSVAPVTVGTGKVREALPMLASVTTCALLVEPTLAAVKVRLGGVVRVISETDFVPLLAT